MMKSFVMAFVALLGLGLLVKAGTVHFDVSADGDVAVNINTNSQQSHAKHRRERLSKPDHGPRKISRVLGDTQVDLEYEVHEGIPSDSKKFLAFKNVPYAEPPIGENRFLEPIPVQTYTAGVNKGEIDNICPQFQVGWVPKQEQFLKDFSKVILPPKWAKKITPADYAPMGDMDSRVNESCLTLDVMVPNKVWEERASSGTKAAVVVWIYGGGYIFGWKSQYGSPEGLFDAAEDDSEQNIIYVAMNYRLGAFGWLGGEKFIEDGGTPNIGLQDQKFALKWVQDYIHLFGGDSGRVTVMGQSAGASSILHHITASGGEYNRPAFTSAILQSPGFFPQPNGTQDDLIYKRFLSLTNAKSLEQLQTADFNTTLLQEANAVITFESMYGYFNFGPTVEPRSYGNARYVPDLPGKLLKQDKFHKGFPLLIGYTNFDGLLFTPPWLRSSSALQSHVKTLFPGIDDTVLAAIEEKYPIPGTLPQNRIAAVSDFFDDIAIQCNVQYLTEASLNSKSRLYHPVFRYSFNALPAIHGYDTGYTYFPSKPLLEPVDPTLARKFQHAIVDFSRYLDPNPEEGPEAELWKPYETNNRKVLDFGAPGQTAPDYSYSYGDDRLDFAKCEYWQDAPYYHSSTEHVDGTLRVQGEPKEWL